MAVLAKTGGSALAWWLGGGAIAAVAVLGGAYYSGALTPDPQPKTPVKVVATAEPDAQEPVVGSEPAAADQNSALTPTKPSPQPATTTAQPPQETWPGPSFDVVRVDPEGNAVIAGTGPAGSKVTIFLNDVELANAQIDSSGAFVSLLSIPLSDQPRILSMVADIAGTTVQSEDQIILAPSPRIAPEIQVATPSGGDGTDQTAPETNPVPVVVATENTQPSTPAISEPVIQNEPAPVEVATAETQPTSPTSDATPVEVATAETQPTTLASPTSDPAPVEIATAETQPTTLASPTSDPAPVEIATTETQPTAPASPTSDPAPVEIATTETQPTAPASPPSDPAPVGVAATGTRPAAPTLPDPVAATNPTPVEMAAVDSQPAAPLIPEPAPLAAETPASAPRPSPAPLTVVRAGANGVELLQSATPSGPLDEVALDTISYSEAGEVQLSGRAQGQSVVRIYLDNNAVADLSVDDRGHWGGNVEGIVPGIYTLRLDEVNTGGDVLSRLETPFKREPPEILHPPHSPQAPDGYQTPLIRAVTVQTGDTLWAISHERYGDGVLYVRVFDANRHNIRNPHLIYPGQVFSIPE